MLDRCTIWLPYYDERQSSRFRVLWSRDVTSSQESLRWFWIQNHQDIWPLAFFFCLQLAASLPLCLPSYCFCYPVQPSSWWINGFPNRPWSLSSSLNPQERTLMDQQVSVPNNRVMRRWARLPWGHIWSGQGVLRRILQSTSSAGAAQLSFSFRNSLLLPGSTHGLDYMECSSHLSPTTVTASKPRARQTPGQSLSPFQDWTCSSSL